jgi:hypothetical protein
METTTQEPQTMTKKTANGIFRSWANLALHTSNINLDDARKMICDDYGISTEELQQAIRIACRG